MISFTTCSAWGGALAHAAYGMPIVSTVHHPLSMDREADFLIDRGFWELATTVLFYPLSMQRIVINRLDRVITSSNEVWARSGGFRAPRGPAFGGV